MISAKLVELVQIHLITLRWFVLVRYYTISAIRLGHTRLCLSIQSNKHVQPALLYISIFQLNLSLLSENVKPLTQFSHNGFAATLIFKQNTSLSTPSTINTHLSMHLYGFLTSPLTPRLPNRVVQSNAASVCLLCDTSHAFTRNHHSQNVQQNA